MADLATALNTWIDAQLPDEGDTKITPTIHRGVLKPLVNAVQGVEDRVDVLYGRPVFTESQRAGIQYIIDQTGGAEGLVLAVAANSDKISFDPESRATLTRLAGETERSEEDVLALIQSAPIPTAVAAEFLSVHGDIDTINGRIDNLPVSEGVPQSVLDDIQALKDRLEFTPAQQLKIMANAGGIADNAQAILDLIQSVADANARIDGNRDARRITPQEILDIADLKDNLVLTQSEKDKINASDAVHTALENRIVKLEAADGGISEDEKTAIADNKEALFGEEIDFVGEWNKNQSYVAGTKQFDALAIGDVVRQTENGEVSYWEVANANFTSAGSTSAPNTPDNQADQDNRWTRKEYMQGLVDITLDEAAVDQRVINQLNPTLITQEAVSAPDVDSEPFTITSDAPFRATDTITIADANANPLLKDVITFTFGLRKTGGNGGFEPKFEYQVVQNGEVLLNRTLANNTDTPTASFRGYLNQPFQVITQGRFLTGDGLTRTFTKHLTFIGGARKGPIYDAMIAAIDNETAADFQFIKGEIAKLKTLTDGVGPALASITERVEGNDSAIGDVRRAGEATRADIETDVMRAVRSATIEPTDTPVIDATPLNTTLGGGGNFAEQIKDNDIGTATQFITRFTDPHQVLQYGAGRIADVFNGRFRVFDLIEEQDAFDTDAPKFLTNTAGFGTNDDPLEIPLGDNQDPKHPLDSTRTLAVGYPVVAPNKSFSNFSLQGYVRVNNSTNYPISALALEPFSGQTQTRALPNVIGVSLVAIDRGADVGVEIQIRHANGGDVQNQPTNNARLFLEVGYVETTTTPRVPRGQEAIDMGAFTGTEVIAIDVGEVGTDAVKTAQIVLPDRTLDTGYFLNEAHRTGFADDNPAFDILISEPETALTPEIMAQLDGADEFLGLFEHTTRHKNAINFGQIGIFTDPTTGEEFAVEKTTGGAGGAGVVAATPAISAFYVNATGTNLETAIANLSMATPSLNQGGNMATDGAYTAPETGVYWMAFRVAVAPSTNNNPLRGGLSIDGAIPTEMQDAGTYTSSGSRDLFVQWAGAVALTKGQVVRLQAGQSSFTGALIPDETYFSGYLIGATG